MASAAWKTHRSPPDWRRNASRSPSARSRTCGCRWCRRSLRIPCRPAGDRALRRPGLLRRLFRVCRGTPRRTTRTPSSRGLSGTSGRQTCCGGFYWDSLANGTSATVPERMSGLCAECPVYQAPKTRRSNACLPTPKWRSFRLCAESLRVRRPGGLAKVAAAGPLKRSDFHHGLRGRCDHRSREVGLGRLLRCTRLALLLSLSPTSEQQTSSDRHARTREQPCHVMRTTEANQPSPPFRPLYAFAAPP
jgi:hypothetical protein